MENNGMLAVYDAWGSDSSDREKEEAKKYLDCLDAFQTGAGQEYLAELRKNKPEKYKALSDSDARNYRNWQNGKSLPERAKLIKLCFDFAITELDEINRLFYAFNYDALHIRKIDELCYYFALTHSIPYEEAKAKASLEQEKFERDYGTNAGESKRTSTGLYTRLVIEEVSTADTWETLEDYIQENKSKLGSIKITAYKSVKKFVEEFSAEDRTNPFYDDETELPFESLLIKVRTSMGLGENNKNIRIWSIMNRTKSVSRGMFILYCLKVFFTELTESGNEISADKLVSAINIELDKCSFARLDGRRCLWDKIVLDSIEAALDAGLWYDDGVTPYYLLKIFLDYIQDLEI